MSYSMGITLAMGMYLAASFLYVRGRRRAASGFLATGIACNLSALVIRGHIGAHWYPDQMVMEDALLPAILAAIMLALDRRPAGGAHPRAALIPLAACALLMLLAPKDQAVPFLRSQTLWAPLFFLTETFSVALFMLAVVLAGAHLAPGRTPPTYMPFMVWGFIAFTICQIVGGIWAYVGWSSPFSWSDRHLASAAVWCLAAAVLHADTAGIQPRTKAACTALLIVPVAYLSLFNTLTETVKRLIEGLA